MKNKYYKFSIVTFLIFIFIIFYYGLKEKNLYAPENIIIKRFPNLSLNDFYSYNESSLDDILIDSNYYLINIWASWCLPCREENDLLKSLSSISSLQIIGINYKDRKKNSIKFLNDYGNPFKYNLVDKDGTASINLGAYGVPETFLVNKNKKILIKIIGPINNDHVKKIREIING